MPPKTATRNPAKRATLTEVARVAGVSSPTASAVLHSTPGNNSGFSEKTRKKVLSAAEKVGYRPNRTVRNFYRKRHGAVGLLVGPDGWLPGETLEAMSRAAREADQMLVLEHGWPGRDGLPIFVEEDAVDGLIVLSEIDEHLHETVRKLKLPMVQVNTNQRDLPGCITYDERGGMAQAVEHLAQCGRKHIGFVSEPIEGAEHYSVTERWEGLREACEANGLQAPLLHELENVWISRLFQPASIIEGATREIQSFIETQSELDALVLAKNVYAPPTYEALHRAGKEIPHDIAVIGVNPYSMIDYQNPVMTSIGLDFELLGRTIFEMLNHAIEHGMEKTHPVHFSMSLCVRESS
ncbi:MAG: LacI family DNA-binding transcriptional regulator [Candidatus Sumerlaeia bacterium]